ncbi:MAG: alpha/beta hydrolase [Pseudomonadota bacterium]
MRRRGFLMSVIGALAACAIADNAVDRARFDVDGARLFMSGEITSRTPATFERLLVENPQLRTVVMTSMQGSLDDAAVLRMGYRLRDAGLDTHLTAQSEIYSGAVDLFLAGNRRSMARGAVIGVHSWADSFGDGASYPPDRPEHRANVRYTADMLGRADFYWFTLQAAPSDAIHVMTDAEIARFGLLT